ncbi:hypothetical protein [Noviherbaspirillum sp.]|uniref:hypothetical protein n=1 Tax=Noviherbaspirillum sp. TaxID=1926288 RepID=UPI002FE24BC9
MSAGRRCPLSYRYSPSVFRADASACADTLYVVGGLYGNTAALEEVMRMYDAERGIKHLIFNGDFNWFDVDPERFRRINETVLSHDAIRGNVESELGPQEDGEDAGCGCAYPDWVDDIVVQRSNAIMRRLAATAAKFPDLRRRLTDLPMWKRIDVGGLPVGIVHGDAQSLAGWGFAPEHLRDDARLAEAAGWLHEGGVRVFACSHTCSPVLQSLADAQGRRCAIINNGAAGMPNFSGMHEGLLTRISTTPHADSVYGMRIDGLYIDALPIRYQRSRWQAEFLAQWPLGSPAHDSYWKRIDEGPAHRVEQAVRVDEAGVAQRMRCAG